MHMDWQDAEADTVLLVRAEAAGMVTGKQGTDPDCYTGTEVAETTRRACRLRVESDPEAVRSASSIATG